ncbi:hypothetical protein GKE82_19695 [Conexibacter sp. W3-3-2]|uniref:Uncharacterized protein n=1 Tax=Paraconexibacter algicola TaxID=2133960 RepID=A0A2T4ULJ7_9ACTN|nr:MULTISPECIES: hypothetical protein [Solirubrobacterales]MTD46449.1 hypothetical protein [Conexibacter sp. W3-3-2]PTL60101.1 hypothetical protein C7Y72_10815 [Paraconexibacter algicola]
MSAPAPVPPPERASRFPFHFALLLLAVPATVTLLGALLGGGPVVAVGLALLVLALVFLGVGGLLRRRGFEERPGRHPVRPPSA